jgi:hypothetical protein
MGMINLENVPRMGGSCVYVARAHIESPATASLLRKINVWYWLIADIDWFNAPTDP